MPTNRYNGRPADTEIIPADTTLVRIMRADATWAADSFNPSPLPIGHPSQGRFEPTDPVLGGYIYLADDSVGAVAEGVLRNQRIPKSGLVQRNWLINKKIVRLELLEDVAVASVHGAGAGKLNLDSAFLCCGRRGYSSTRQAGTGILLNTPAAQGLRYPCRNHDGRTSLMLVTRGATPPRLSVADERDIFIDPDGRAEVLKVLDKVWGLHYTGALP